MQNSSGARVTCAIGVNLTSWVVFNSNVEFMMKALNVLLSSKYSSIHVYSIES